jgi:hypothetical protein
VHVISSRSGDRTVQYSDNNLLDDGLSSDGHMVIRLPRTNPISTPLKIYGEMSSSGLDTAMSQAG